MFDEGTLLYFSMPKTATTTSIAVLNEHLAARGDQPQINRKHTPARQAPYFIRERRLCVGTIRDPLSWYRSVYNHNPATRQQIRKSWSRGKTGFKAAVYGFTHPKELEDYTRAYGSVLGPGNVREMFQYCETGLWTWSTRWFYQGPDGSWLLDRLIDIKSIKPAWDQLLGTRYKGRVLNGARVSIKDETPYDEEMLEWVRQADGELWDELYDNIEPKSSLFVV